MITLTPIVHWYCLLTLLTPGQVARGMYSGAGVGEHELSSGCMFVDPIVIATGRDEVKSTQ